jgi:hypothetical protein
MFTFIHWTPNGFHTIVRSNQKDVGTLLKAKWSIAMEEKSFTNWISHQFDLTKKIGLKYVF